MQSPRDTSKICPKVLLAHFAFTVSLLSHSQTPLTFCAANTQDVEMAVNHVKELYPQAPLFGAGVSLGG